MDQLAPHPTVALGRSHLTRRPKAPEQGAPEWVTCARACALASVVLAAGCAPSIERAGDTTFVTWNPWFVALTIVVPCVLALGAARWLGRPGRRVYGALLALAAVCGALVGFVAATSRITLTQDEVFDHCGFPGARSKRGIHIADVERVEAFLRVEHGYRSTKREHVWALTFRDGRTEELVVGDLWTAAHDELAAHLTARGVAVEAR